MSDNSKKKYSYGWSVVNIRPDTKEQLQILCKALGNKYSELPMSTVLDLLIRERIQQL